MTDTPPPPMPVDPKPEPHCVTDPYEPLNGTPGCAEYLDALLKTPNRLYTDIRMNNAAKAFRFLSLIALAGLLCYGLITGLFSGGTQLLWAPLKVLAVVVGSSLLCLPSLYIFTCLSRVEVHPLELMAHSMSGLALTSVLLLGLAPVLFLFSVSTESLFFMGVLHLMIWVATGMAGSGRFLQALKNLRGSDSAYPRLWLGIFCLVLLQMSTTLRPILGSAPEVFTPEKEFFLLHWLRVMGG